MNFFRWEPHRDDPEKCHFDFWTMTYPVEGNRVYTERTAERAVELKDAEFEHMVYPDDPRLENLSDTVVYQDWGLTKGQKGGWAFTRLSRAHLGKPRNPCASLSRSAERLSGRETTLEKIARPVSYSI